MERIFNDEDKIKRAEEIYYRRNNQTLNFENKLKTSKNKNSFWLNFLLMFNIAIIVFCVQNKNFIFTREFLDVLNKYNIEASNKIINFFEGIVSEDNLINENTLENNIVHDNNTIENANHVNEVENNVNTINNSNEVSEQLVDLSSTLDEMEEDVKNLKNAYSFIKPLSGVVSSEFGARESKFQNVTGYHTGIDIAADMGKEIKASMQGIVELVSSEGNYGKHIKIRCNNVTTLYAHCSKIYVRQGQVVGQGQKIAAVGNTGNSTGPHLHFEIRVDNRFVNPAEIIEFN